MQFITPKPTDTLGSLGVQPGWYVRHSCGSIWREVTALVAGKWVICAARDPKKGTEMASIGNNYSSINEFCTARPDAPGRSWVAADRTKNFFDKFHPEREHIVWMQKSQSAAVAS